MMHVTAWVDCVYLLDTLRNAPIVVDNPRVHESSTTKNVPTHLIDIPALRPYITLPISSRLVKEKVKKRCKSSFIGTNLLRNQNRNGNTSTLAVTTTRRSEWDSSDRNKISLAKAQSQIEMMKKSITANGVFSDLVFHVPNNHDVAPRLPSRSSQTNLQETRIPNQTSRDNTKSAETLKNRTCTAPRLPCRLSSCHSPLFSNHHGTKPTITITAAAAALTAAPTITTASAHNTCTNLNTISNGNDTSLSSVSCRDINCNKSNKSTHKRSTTFIKKSNASGKRDEAKKAIDSALDFACMYRF